jgi:alpha-L-fucosidase
VYDWNGFFDVVRDCQPNAVIFSDGGPDVRWVGNENGFAGETNWSLLRRDEVYPGYPEYQELTSGHANGTHWVPAECDVSIRPNWYYRAADDTCVKSVDTLVEIYFKSVGRNGSLLLNVPPDTRGLISDVDVNALMGFRRALDSMFSHNLAHGAIVTASNVRGNDTTFAAAKTIDLSATTYWATGDSVMSASLTFDFGKPIDVNCILVQEHIALGQRVESFTLDGWDGSCWIPLDIGTTIGYKRILRFPTVKVSKIRLSILKSRACPTIENVSVYGIPDEFVPKRGS